jgi:hypothetical protein
MKKIGFVILALVLVLGTMGVGYAMWSQTMTVNGNVNTGNVCLKFVPMLRSSDPGPNYMGYNPPNVYAPSLDWTIQPGMDPSTIHALDKNIGETDVALGADPQHVNVTLTNVYPCYYAEVYLHEQNCGTIPVKLTGAVLTYPDPNNPDQFISITLTQGDVYNIPGLTQYANDPVDSVIEIRWMAFQAGAQLEPGQVIETSWSIHILQAARQNFNYGFTISFAGVQWNEYTPGMAIPIQAGG